MGAGFPLLIFKKSWWSSINRNIGYISGDIKFISDKIYQK
jgi:hypothetical protein